MEKIPAPRGLKAAGKKLWNGIAHKYEMREDEMVTLQAACAEADLIARMEAALKDEPLTVTGSMGQLVAHPLVQELRQHRATMAGLLAKIKFQDDAVSAGATNQQRAAAQSRWAASRGAAA